MSFPTRSQIFQDPIWTIKDTVARPSLDTFYQVDFAFSGNVDKWMNVNRSTYTEKSRALASGSKRLTGGQVTRKLMLLCAEAEIPGTSYLTTQVDGNHQGISEIFPTFRQFPPLNLTFYLDADHVVLEVFESWMRYINPLSTDDKKRNAYSRFNYPETYKERIHITKYERDIKTPRKNFVDRSTSSLQQNNSSLMSFYEFVNVWPTNMTSMRVNYGSSDLIRVSVQLSYDRFFTRFGLRDSPRETPMNIPSEQIWRAAANNSLPDFLSDFNSGSTFLDGSPKNSNYWNTRELSNRAKKVMSPNFLPFIK